MVCPKCGRNLPEGAVYCTGCGAALPVHRPVPQVRQGYTPQAGQGYTPQAGQGYVPQAGRGYTPQAGQGYTPRAGQGYTPQVGQGHTPQQAGGTPYRNPAQQWTPPPPPRVPQQPAGARPVCHRAMSRKEFLASAAGAKARKWSWLVLLTMVLALALIVTGVFLFQNRSLLNLSSLSRVLAMVDSPELDELLALVEGDLQQVLDQLELDMTGLTAGQTRILEEFTDGLRVLARKPSVNNFAKFAQFYTDHARQLKREFGIPGEITDVMDTVAQVVKLLPWMIWGLFFLPLLFTLLSGLMKNIPLTVTAMILSFLAQFLLCSVYITGGTLVVFIAQILLCSEINREFKNKRYVPMNA